MTLQLALDVTAITLHHYPTEKQLYSLLSNGHKSCIKDAFYITMTITNVG